MWKINKSRPVPNPDDAAEDGDEAGASSHSGDYSSGGSSSGEDSGKVPQEILIRVKEKVEANKENTEKLYQLLMLLVDRYSNVLKDIDEFF